MKRCFGYLMLLALIAVGADTVAAQSRAIAAFDKLKSLAGEWEGPGPDGRAVEVSYQVTSGGWVLIETMTPPDEPVMVTMYHLDGDRIMVTHYCSAGNQPRLVAEIPEGTVKTLHFKYAGATNLAKPDDGHMHGMVLTFQDRDHITQVWTWRDGGKDTPGTFTLRRKSAG